MMRYRKKPVEIDAIQFDGTEGNAKKIIQTFQNPHRVILYHARKATGDPKLSIPTLEGKMVADVGDWIIRGIEGEIYPCKPGIFEQTYERVTNCNTDEETENES